VALGGCLPTVQLGR
nr:RecName: Full=Peroxidase 5 [Betula pendula]